MTYDPRMLFQADDDIPSGDNVYSAITTSWVSGSSEPATLTNAEAIGQLSTTVNDAFQLGLTALETTNSNSVQRRGGSMLIGYTPDETSFYQIYNTYYGGSLTPINIVSNTDSNNLKSVYPTMSDVVSESANAYSINTLYNGLDSNIDGSIGICTLPYQVSNTDYYHTGTQFELLYNNTATDVLGWDGQDSNNYHANTNDSNNNYIKESLFKYLYANSSSVLERKLGSSITVPSTSFNTDDWDNLEPSESGNVILGDPHVTTLSGDHYHFNYLGAFRLLDNNDKVHPFIMNGQSEYGPDRWSERQYIRKVYIYEHGKSMIVDLGFRGSKATILYNEGFTITEKELPFHSTARMYCVDNHMSF